MFYTFEKTFELRPARQKPEEEWSGPRLRVASVVQHQWFDLCMGMVILFNVVIMIIEADANAGEGCEDATCAALWLVVMNQILLGIYTVEAAAVFYVSRAMYWFSVWNYLDLFIIVAGWLDVVVTAAGDKEIPNFQMLRVLRIVRLARAARLLKFFPELYVMIRGFFCALKAMFWGLVLILVLLVVWSLFAVEIIHPINKGLPHEHWWCEVAFQSTWNATVLLFQTLVAGDSWGACAIPVIMKHEWTFFIFALATVSVSLGFTNLILAVIVDTAASAREMDMQEQLTKKREEEAEGIKRWEALIKMIDVDGNGQITQEELLDGYDQVQEIRDTLTMIDISRADLEILFSLMDDDESGSLSYDEFISSIQRAQGQDMRMYLMLMKLELGQLTRGVTQQAAAITKIQKALNIPQPEVLQEKPRPGEVVRRGSLSSLPKEPAARKPMSMAKQSSGFLQSELKTAKPGAAEPTNKEPTNKGPFKEHSRDLGLSQKDIDAVVIEASLSHATPSAFAQQQRTSFTAGLDTEFARLTRNLDCRFEELAKSIGQNTTALAHHTRQIEEMLGAPDGGKSGTPSGGRHAPSLQQPPSAEDGARKAPHVLQPSPAHGSPPPRCDEAPPAELDGPAASRAAAAEAGGRWARRVVDLDDIGSVANAQL